MSERPEGLDEMVAGAEARLREQVRPDDSVKLWERSWMWLPNANVTRLHAVRRRAAGEHYTPTACDSWGLVLADTAVSGDMPPKCKRCLKAIERWEQP